jgi:GWxTD domain-containing protein
MNNLRHSLLLLLLSAGVLWQSPAQPENIPAPVMDLPRMYVEIFGFLTPHGDEPKVDVYIDVPYESVHFIKQNDLFRASYDITVDIHDSTEKLVAERYWRETIETKNFDESISPHIGKLSQRSFSLQPGSYEMIVQLSDPETKKGSQIKRKFRFRDLLEGSMAVSDLMIVNQIDTVGGKKFLSPNVAGNIADVNNGFFLFFEVYNRAAAESIAVVSRIRGGRGEDLRRDTLREWISGPRKSIVFPVKDTSLIAGEYSVEVGCYRLSGGKPVTENGLLASSVRPFAVRWRGMPSTISDMNLAVEQLQYIAEKDIIEKMKDAPLPEKRNLFKSFWKQRDPTPNTERNEMMEEYYFRVAYANRHFSHYLDGWKTDMGMIFIIFGEPNNIERHPFDIDSKPYEIWTYYDQNREFTFVDATGFGDYRLQNPLWDMWRTRPR